MFNRRNKINLDDGTKRANFHLSRILTSSAVTGIVLITLIVGGLFLFGHTGTSKIKLSSNKLSTESQTTTSNVVRSANPWNITKIANCPFPINRQWISQKIYDYVCQQIAEGKLKYPPTYPNGNGGSLVPPPSPPTVTNTTLPSSLQTSGFDSYCVQEFTANGFFDSNEGQHLGVNSGGLGVYFDANANGNLVCAIPAIDEVYGQPTQYLLMVFYESISNAIKNHGVVANNSPKLLFDPVSGGAVTITSANGNILTIADSSGNSYTLNLGTISSLPQTSYLTK